MLNILSLALMKVTTPVKSYFVPLSQSTEKTSAAMVDRILHSLQALNLRSMFQLAAI